MNIGKKESRNIIFPGKKPNNQFLGRGIGD
jgi:hypothetical protein